MCREVVNRGSECFADVTHPALLFLCRPREGGGRGERGNEGGRERGRKGGKEEEKEGKEEEGYK